MKNCLKCGFEIEEDDNFCPKCGQQTPKGYFFLKDNNNVFPNKSSDSYLSTKNSLINASIENTSYQKGKLIVTITGEAIKGCIKTTKTIPDNNSACWVKINNHKFSVSVLKNKTYYIWLMDENGLISNKYDYHSK